MEPSKPSVRFRPKMATDNGSATPPNGSIASPESFKASESDSLSPDGYVEAKYQSMTEKGIRRLCSELLDLKKASAEEMRRNVFANYNAFIRISQEVSGLEMELMAMRSLISTHAVLVRDLLEGVSSDISSSSRSSPASEEVLHFGNDREPLELDTHLQVLSDVLDVLLAEHRIDEALAAFDEAEMTSSNAQSDALGPATISCFHSALSERKARFVEQLAEVACQATIRGTELRKVVSALNHLGDGPRAHTLLLTSYHARLQNNVMNLHPTCTWYTGSYTAALAQIYFSTISQASRDSLNIFGEAPAYASELVLWARKETEEYVALMKKHVLSFSAVAGGFKAAADCFQISIGHCSLLEGQGLALCPFMLKLVKPCIEAAIDATLRRIKEAVKAHVTSDNWVLTFSPFDGADNRGSYISAAASGSSTYLKLSRSAYIFNSMVQDLLGDVTPVMSKHFGNSVLEGIAHLFDSYIEMLIKAVPGPESEDVTDVKDYFDARMAETEAQQLAVLGNAAALADELLPRAALKLSSSQQNTKEESRRRALDRKAMMPEQKEWRRHLQRAVDRIRDHFCRQHALDLVYNKDGESLVTADMYLSFYVNDQNWHQDLVPSPPFQALFVKLNTFAKLAADMLAGRERVVVLLLMRLTETVVMWLADDQDFWEAIEDGTRILGPVGLQQFVLDMQFVIEIASYGRYSSRHIRHVVSAIISRAVNAFSTTGIDSTSVLPEDEWFQDIAKETIQKILLGVSKGNPTINERDPGSPVSISGQSTHSAQGSP